METLKEPANFNEEYFIFRPLASTKWALQTSGISPTVSWKPFTDWPGNRWTIGKYIGLFNRQHKRFELRIPHLEWPLDFVLPMDRLSLPSTDATNFGDTVNILYIHIDALAMKHFLSRKINSTSQKRRDNLLRLQVTYNFQIKSADQ